MRPFNKSFVFCVLFLNVMLSSQIDAKDYPSPYQPYSKVLAYSNDQTERQNLDQAAYARMSIEDPVLKRAYCAMFGSISGPILYFGRPELDMIVTDIRSRGNDITPMLLKLMQENQETGFECSVLINIAKVGTVDLTPYLDYVRDVLRERISTMSAGLAGCAASLLASHGTIEDGELLKWVMETRPYVADSVTRKLDGLNRRLNLPKQGTRPELRDTQPTPETAGENSQRELKRPAVPTEEEAALISPWFKWCILLLVLAVLLWLGIISRKTTNS